MRPLLSLSLSLAVLAGCGGRYDVLMRNPIAAGVVDQPNTVQRGMSQATLLRLDEQAICFEMHLARQNDYSPATVVPSQSQLFLLTDDGEYGDVTILQESEMEVYQSVRYEQRQRQVGTERYCSNRDNRNQCTTWSTRPVYQTYSEEVPVFETRASGQACFPNLQRVHAYTQRVTLRTAFARFRWGFDVPEQPEGQAQAAPVEAEESSGGEDPFIDPQ